MCGVWTEKLSVIFDEFLNCGLYGGLLALIIDTFDVFLNR